MNSYFSPTYRCVEQWREILLHSLEVSTNPGSLEELTHYSHQGLYRWFPEYSINVYKNLVTRHLGLSAEKHCLKTLDIAGRYSAYSYDELDSLVRQVATRINLKPRDKFAIVGDPTIETAVLVLASAFLGCHHTVVIPSLPKDAIAARLDLFDPRIVVVPQNYERLGEKRDSSFRVATLKICGREVWFDNDHLSAQAPHYSQSESYSYGADDNLFTLFTSGSTGFPKGIVHGASGFMLFAHYTSHYFFNLCSNSTILCGASSGWINGHTYGLYSPLLHGATSVLVEEPARLSMMAPLTDILATAKVSILYLPVTTVRILRSVSGMSSPPNLASPLESLGTMGEMLAPSTEHWYSHFFSGGRLPVVNTYFQTETGGVLCGKTFKQPPGISEGEIGPLPWFSDISEENGILVLKQSVPGLMVDILSPNREKHFQQYFHSGGYFLHDYGRVVEGTLFCSGRSDDIINIKGVRLASGAIESHLLSLSDIVECAAVEYKNSMELTDMRIFVVLSDNSRLTNDSYKYQLLSQVTLLLKEGVSKQASPGSIVFLETLPKTISGKILRRLLRYLTIPTSTNIVTMTLSDSANITILGDV